MTSLQECYHIAKQENIAVDHFPLSKRAALSVMDEDGVCFIAIDPTKIASNTEERVILSHELGHCITGSFYNQYSNYDCRQRHENRADKWAVKKLIPVDELEDAVTAGYTELWELAERFDVTEDFIRKAVCYYVYGNLAAELYF